MWNSQRGCNELFTKVFMPVLDHIHKRIQPQEHVVEEARAPTHQVNEM